MKWIFSLLLFLFTSLSHSQEKEGFVPVDGFQLHYKIYGSKGKPLLIVNGGPGFSSNYVDDVAVEIAKEMKRQVIVFDPRGTGKSVVKPINRRNINLRNQVSDIEAIKNHLNINKWDVIGHAYGGAIAILYTHKYPKSVHRLVLSSSIGPNLDFVPPMLSNLKVRLSLRHLEELDKISQKKVSGELTESQFYKQRFDLLTDAYVFDKTKIEQVRNMITLETDYNLHVNQLLWNEMSDQGFNIEKKVSEIQQPVLILHGHQDVIGESVPMLLNSLFPNAKLIFVNEAGRYIWIDQPTQYFHYLEEFLN